jgi:hypothetical protein
MDQKQKAIRAKPGYGCLIPLLSDTRRGMKRDRVVLERQRMQAARIWRVADGNLEAATRIIVGFIMTQPGGSITISARVG